MGFELIYLLFWFSFIIGWEEERNEFERMLKYGISFKDIELIEGIVKEKCEFILGSCVDK